MKRFSAKQNFAKFFLVYAAGALSILILNPIELALANPHGSVASADSGEAELMALLKKYPDLQEKLQRVFAQPGQQGGPVTSEEEEAAHRKVQAVVMQYLLHQETIEVPLPTYHSNALNETVAQRLAKYQTELRQLPNTPANEERRKAISHRLHEVGMTEELSSKIADSTQSGAAYHVGVNDAYMQYLVAHEGVIATSSKMDNLQKSTLIGQNRKTHSAAQNYHSVLQEVVAKPQNQATTPSAKLEDDLKVAAAYQKMAHQFSMSVPDGGARKGKAIEYHDHVSAYIDDLKAHKAAVDAFHTDKSEAAAQRVNATRDQAHAAFEQVQASHRELVAAKDERAVPPTTSPPSGFSRARPVVSKVPVSQPDLGQPPEQKLKVKKTPSQRQERRQTKQSRGSGRKPQTAQRVFIVRPGVPTQAQQAQGSPGNNYNYNNVHNYPPNYHPPVYPDVHPPVYPPYDPHHGQPQPAGVQNGVASGTGGAGGNHRLDIYLHYPEGSGGGGGKKNDGKSNANSKATVEAEESDVDRNGGKKDLRGKQQRKSSAKMVEVQKEKSEIPGPWLLRKTGLPLTDPIYEDSGKPEVQEKDRLQRSRQVGPAYYKPEYTKTTGPEPRRPLQGYLREKGPNDYDKFKHVEPTGKHDTQFQGVPSGPGEPLRFPRKLRGDRFENSKAEAIKEVVGGVKTGGKLLPLLQPFKTEDQVFLGAEKIKADDQSLEKKHNGINYGNICTESEGEITEHIFRSPDEKALRKQMEAMRRKILDQKGKIVDCIDHGSHTDQIPGQLAVVRSRIRSIIHYDPPTTGEGSARSTTTSRHKPSGINSESSSSSSGVSNVEIGK